jgi:hypothetical protein
LFKAVFDQMATSAFDHTGANGPTLGQIALVVHKGSITAQVSADAGEGELLSRRQGDSLSVQVVEQGIELVIQQPGECLLSAHAAGGLHERAVLKNEHDDPVRIPARGSLR